MRKKLLLTAAGLAIIGATSFGAVAAFAQEQTTNSMDSLVEKIAQRFNLNKDEVQKVFDEQKDVHHARMKANLETKLSQAVSDGKINDTQKQAILNKFGEMKPFVKKIEPGQEINEEEMKKLHEEKRLEMESWAKENNIDLNILREILGKGAGGFNQRGMIYKAF